MPGMKGEPMKHKHFNRLLSMLLVVATLFGLLAVPASAATLGDSGTVTIKQAGYGKLFVNEMCLSATKKP